MKKSYLPRKKDVYLLLLVLMVVLVPLMPRSGKFNKDYKKGSPWAYETLIADFDFPLLKTSEQLLLELEASSSQVVPYYRYHEEVGMSAIRSVEKLDLGELNYLKSIIVTSLSDIYSHGVIDDEFYPGSEKGSFSSSKVMFVQKDKRAIQVPVSDAYSLSRARTKLCADVGGNVSLSLNVDSLLTATGVYALLSADLKYDKETTGLVHAESSSYISPTEGYVYAGQLIVSQGEIVTSEIEQMLNSYKEEYEQTIGYSGSMVSMWLGNTLMSFLLCLLLFLSILFTNANIFLDRRSFSYLLFMVLLSTLLVLWMGRWGSRQLYLAPFFVLTLFMLAFFKKRVVVPVYTICLLPLLVFLSNGVELFMINLVTGFVSMLSFQYFSRSWRQFIFAFIVSLSAQVVYLSFCLVFGNNPEWIKVLFLFVGSFLSVLFYPLIYLFEKLFGLVSNNRLAELCDTNNNRLLRELSVKAPGTFQHSLQVMNMADAASGSIDANVLLARAGALYHDIGKLANPQCFVENEGPGVDYHSGMSYQDSAGAIIRHVEDGLALADKYHLPAVLKAFISTHHGKSVTAYFYNKYVNGGGDPREKQAFTYPGPKPQTKEQTIVMLCDTLEAASRTIKDNSPETFDDFVEKIVRSKIDEGQLDDSPISLQELGIVKHTLKAYLVRLYHERVVYPKRNR